MHRLIWEIAVCYEHRIPPSHELRILHPTSEKRKSRSPKVLSSAIQHAQTCSQRLQREAGMLKLLRGACEFVGLCDAGSS